MNTINKITVAALGTVLLASSCVKDLDVTPIDPNLNTAEAALVAQESYKSLLSSTYFGFAASSYNGPNGAPSISGLDGGASQYIRGLYNLNSLPTDESVCGWDDQTIKDFHAIKWTTTDIFIYGFYSRIFNQISICNEFLRQAAETPIEVPEIEVYKAEARALRAYCYFHALDNFGNVPFSDENTTVGTFPEQISRQALYEWLVGELNDLIDNSALKAARTNEYGRVDKGFAMTLLAKVYLNAEVYTGKAEWQKCADVCAQIEALGYSLHPKFAELFMADNDKCTDEIIFAIQQDGVNTQSYGVTNFIIFASTGGKMDTNYMGISSGWGGLRTTPEFYDLFKDDKVRGLFFTGEEQKKDIDVMKDFTNGYAFMKFRNVNSDGSIPNQTVGEDGSVSNPGFVNTDFPVFRYADVLLMEAECAKRGATVPNAQAAWDAVRSRAGMSTGSYTLEDVLDERVREFAQECWRRQDLIRFDKFAGNSYNWQWKGGVKEGTSIPEYRELYPIPTPDLNANAAKLVQNPGY